MTNEDEEVLKDINRSIGDEESEGRWESLRDRLATQTLRTGGEAPVLAFRRVSGACVDARAFLDGVAKGPRRMVGEISITPAGHCRAIVRCVVEMDGKRYDNLRVFVRPDKDSRDWRLLAWANEDLA